LGQNQKCSSHVLVLETRKEGPHHRQTFLKMTRGVARFWIPSSAQENQQGSRDGDIHLRCKRLCMWPMRLLNASRCQFETPDLD
jgi:hypothetical protein